MVLFPCGSVTLYVEMACNGLFGAGQGSMIASPDPNRKYSVQKAELVILHRDVREMLTDFEMMVDIVNVDSSYANFSQYDKCKVIT